MAFVLRLLHSENGAFHVVLGLRSVLKRWEAMVAVDVWSLTLASLRAVGTIAVMALAGFSMTRLGVISHLELKSYSPFGSFWVDENVSSSGLLHRFVSQAIGPLRQ